MLWASKDKDDPSLAPGLKLRLSLADRAFYLSLASGFWLPSTLPLLLCKSPSPLDIFMVWYFQHISPCGAVLCTGSPIFFMHIWNPSDLCAHRRGNSEGMCLTFIPITAFSIERDARITKPMQPQIYGYGFRLLHCKSRQHLTPTLLLPSPRTWSPGLMQQQISHWCMWDLMVSSNLG